MRRIVVEFVIAHVLLAALVGVILLMPDARKVYPATALLVAIGVIELCYLLALFRGRKLDPFPSGSSDIICAVWVLMLVWELSSTKLGIAHSVLIPSPENVFYVFQRSGPELWANVVSSLELLLSGYILGTALGVILGVVVGWVPRLRAMFYPIANVLAPIPSVIFTPFLVILMPSYRWAAIMVILLGVFWPQFLSMILRVGSLPQAITDNARVLKVSNWTMITKIILPFIVPDVLKNMRVSLTTGFLMLMYAESFGAKSGIGYWISNANVFANYANIVAGVITCGMTVTALNYLTAWLQKRFTTWR
ncbi:ABC transporter permease [Adlercreutzia faecimuris]|uniref:ABC transporter permease subunit n=1 Tax=Adlercreutzia faecimuris TaxID=2897341 RepID=A0ABS9WE91_9ACTN|nr:ABC transporter permease subunit [Adlercreutzia sp. JBNU-10]MCI2241189.1 ABC transporter permease subunit [Adlercreutzia sp. JBNU-10]